MPSSPPRAPDRADTIHSVLSRMRLRPFLAFRSVHDLTHENMALDTHYTEKITLDALAERFYINKFYLTRVFKEQFGQSVTNYLVQLRITQSKRLLRFTDRSIEAVAQECGLNDANYFSRLFKKVEGITPGEYRRQW